MLDRFSFGREVAVGHVNGAVLGLDHAGVVVLARGLLVRVAVQMATPFPGCAFVVAHDGDQRVSALREVVVDHDPVPVLQADDFQAGSRIQDVGVARGRPGDAVVLRGADVGALRRWTVVA